MSNFRKLLSFLIIVATAIMMSGCFPDMGEFEDELDYVDSFGDVYLYYEKDGVIKRDKYDFSDFFYEDIGEELVVPDDMEPLEYSYMAVEIDDDLKIQELYLYLLGDTSGSITVDIIASSELLDISMLRPYNSGKTKKVHNDETDEDEDVPYTDVFSTSKYHTSSSLSKGRWTSFGCSFCRYKGSKITSGEPLEVEDGDYLIFRFKNNTAYGKDESLPKYNFQTTALLIRAI